MSSALRAAGVAALAARGSSGEDGTELFDWIAGSIEKIDARPDSRNEMERELDNGKFSELMQAVLAKVDARESIPADGKGQNNKREPEDWAVGDARGDVDDDQQQRRSYLYPTISDEEVELASLGREKLADIKTNGYAKPKSVTELVRAKSPDGADEDNKSKNTKGKVWPTVSWNGVKDGQQKHVTSVAEKISLPSRRPGSRTYMSREKQARNAQNFRTDGSAQTPRIKTLFGNLFSAGKKDSKKDSITTRKSESTSPTASQVSTARGQAGKR